MTNSCPNCLKWFTSSLRSAACGCGSSVPPSISSKLSFPHLIRHVFSVIFTSATEGGWKLCLHPCLSVSRISQNVMNGFRQNLVDKLGVWQGINDSILVKIQIWILSRFKQFFTNERWGQKLYPSIHPSGPYSIQSITAAKAVSWAIGHNLGWVTTAMQDTQTAQSYQQAGKCSPFYGK